jgi:hypothetical protein
VNLTSRIERLESKVRREAIQTIRIGLLRPLPADYRGERHIVLVKRKGTASGYPEYEERPGRGPRRRTQDDFPTIFMSEDDLAL